MNLSGVLHLNVTCLHPSRGLLLLALVLSACASAPPPRLYQLRADPPVAVQRVASAQVLQLVAVQLPEVLALAGLVVPQGQGGVQVLADHRWAEPLRDAVPRLLRQDLAQLLGAQRVWAVPLPAGVVATQALRVEIITLQARADRSAVQLLARVTLGAQVLMVALDAPSAGPEPDALVAAHRLALWRLAEQIAAAVR